MVTNITSYNNKKNSATKISHKLKKIKCTKVFCDEWDALIHSRLSTTITGLITLIAC